MAKPTTPPPPPPPPKQPRTWTIITTPSGNEVAVSNKGDVTNVNVSGSTGSISYARGGSGSGSTAEDTLVKQQLSTIQQNKNITAYNASLQSTPTTQIKTFQESQQPQTQQPKDIKPGNIITFGAVRTPNKFEELADAKIYGGKYTSKELKQEQLKTLETNRQDITSRARAFGIAEPLVKILDFAYESKKTNKSPPQVIQSRIAEKRTLIPLNREEKQIIANVKEYETPIKIASVSALAIPVAPALAGLGFGLAFTGAGLTAVTQIAGEKEALKFNIEQQNRRLGLNQQFNTQLTQFQEVKPKIYEQELQRAKDLGYIGNEAEKVAQKSAQQRYREVIGQSYKEAYPNMTQEEINKQMKKIESDTADYGFIKSGLNLGFTKLSGEGLLFGLNPLFQKQEDFTNDVSTYYASQGYTGKELEKKISKARTARITTGLSELAALVNIGKATEISGRQSFKLITQDLAKKGVTYGTKEAGSKLALKFVPTLAKLGAYEGASSVYVQDIARNQKTDAKGYATAAIFGAATATLLGAPIIKYSVDKSVGKRAFVETIGNLADPLEGGGDALASAQIAAFKKLGLYPKDFANTNIFISGNKGAKVSFKAPQSTPSINPNIQIRTSAFVDTESEGLNTKNVFKQIDIGEYLPAQTKTTTKTTTKTNVPIPSENYILSQLGIPIQTQTQTPTPTEIILPNLTPVNVPIGTETPTQTQTQTNTIVDTFVPVNVPVFTPIMRLPPPIIFPPQFSGFGGGGATRTKQKTYIDEISASFNLLGNFGGVNALSTLKKPSSRKTKLSKKHKTQTTKKSILDEFLGMRF